MTPQQLTAPYGLRSNLSTTTPTVRGCGREHITPAAFNNSSGVGTFAARAKARSCGNASGGPFNVTTSAVLGKTSLIVPVIAAPVGGGPTSVEIMVNISYFAHAFNSSKIRWDCPPAHRNRTSHGLVSSDCTASASVSFSFSVVIVDLSGPGSFFSSNQVFGYTMSLADYSYDNCYGYGCWWSNYSYGSTSGALRGNATWFFNATLSPGDLYAATIGFTGLVQTQIKGFPRSEIGAGLDLGKRGHDWNVTSIYVS